MLALGAVILVGLNLRPALAAIGPLLDQIQAGTGLGNVQASLLTTLPILAMGIGALFASSLQWSMGEHRGVAVGLVVIGFACAARAVVNDAGAMILTAACIGMGIALVQALLPAFLKRQFPGHISQATGLYTTSIMAGAVLAAGTASPLAAWMGWPMLLALWGLPALAAAIAWSKLPATRAPPALSPSPARRKTHGARMWLLVVFFGISTSAYTLVLAWLPPYYTEQGWSAAQSGYLQSGITVTEVIAGLLVSALIGRYPDRRKPVIAVLLILLAGLICMIVAPTSLALPVMVLVGVGIGALFPLSLIVTMDHAHDAAGAARLAGFVQGGGYILASAMPLLAGLLREHFADLTHAWTLMAGGVLILIAMALRLSPESARRLAAG